MISSFSLKNIKSIQKLIEGRESIDESLVMNETEIGVDPPSHLPKFFSVSHSTKDLRERVVKDSFYQTLHQPVEWSKSTTPLRPNSKETPLAKVSQAELYSLLQDISDEFTDEHVVRLIKIAESNQDQIKYNIEDIGIN